MIAPILLAGLAQTAFGQEVRWLDTEVVVDAAQQQTVVRVALELTGTPHTWYGVYYQFRLDGDTPLKGADGKEIFKKWADLFMPENVPARWTQCRGVFTFAEIAAAANLPRGKRTTLWAVGLLWDPAGNKWVGPVGWNARTALIVTTDDAGKITKAETFYAPPSKTVANHASEKIGAKECALDLKHLQLRDGAKLYRTVGLRHETYDTLVMGDNQSPLREDARGFAFGAIDTPEKALELAELGLPRAVIINTPQQYQAIVAELKKVQRWDPAKFLRVETPASYGAQVTAEPGLGWRVRILAAYHHPYMNLGLRSIVLHDFAITNDGRIGHTETVCIAGPQTPYGAPPGWEPEFGWSRPAPAVPATPGAPFAPTAPVAPSSPATPLFSMTAAIDAYNKALRDALTAEGSTTIPAFIRVLDKRTTIPCPAGSAAQWFLNDVDNWPKEASR